jgi:hypothetical protein
VDALQQRLEVEVVVRRDHDLAVDDTALGQVRLQRRDHLREIAGEWLLAPAGELDLVTVAEGDGAEPVELGFVEVVTLRDGLDGLGEHGAQGWVQRQVHAGHLAVRRRWRERAGQAGFLDA